MEKFNNQLKILDETRVVLEKARDKINTIEPERVSELSREIIDAKRVLDDKSKELNELDAQAKLFKELDIKLLRKKYGINARPATHWRRYCELTS